MEVKYILIKICQTIRRYHFERKMDSEYEKKKNPKYRVYTYRKFVYGALGSAGMTGDKTRFWRTSGDAFSVSATLATIGTKAFDVVIGASGVKWIGGLGRVEL